MGHVLASPEQVVGLRNPRCTAISKPLPSVAGVIIPNRCSTKISGIRDLVQLLWGVLVASHL